MSSCFLSLGRLLGGVYAIGFIVFTFWGEVLYLAEHSLAEWLFFGFLKPAVLALVWPLMAGSYF